MEIDKTTYYDLSVFNTEDEFSVFRKIDFTRTSGGRNQLHQLMLSPYHELDKILSTQAALQLILRHEADWPLAITNGTVMVIEKFFEYNADPIPNSFSPIEAIMYKWLHSGDFSMVKYSVGHFIDFVKGLQKLMDIFLRDDTPIVLRNLLKEAARRLDKETIRQMLGSGRTDEMPRAQMLRFGNFILYQFKHDALELINIYNYLDAYFGMAMAVKKHNLAFPVITDQPTPKVKVIGLYHILLQHPVPYDLELNKDNTFLFLTGANMAGKSTFIKSVGISVFLAHIGMGVPAQKMELSLFDGLLSNIQVQDNVLKGESYFYNEVQRVKSTVLKVTNGKKWLILIDELFKGTNIQDAMNCSAAVIQGLVKVKSSLFILSTHLYEIGDSLRPYSNIAFRFFETFAEDDQLRFSYQLKEGVSNDRIGYLILKREKVVEMLENIPG